MESLNDQTKRLANIILRFSKYALLSTEMQKKQEKFLIDIQSGDENALDGAEKTLDEYKQSMYPTDGMSLPN